MKYIKDDGGLWELTDFKYRKFLQHGAKGKGYCLSDFGEKVADQVVEVIGWGYVDFQNALSELDNE